jgi:hypothetical protein
MGNGGSSGVVVAHGISGISRGGSGGSLGVVVARWEWWLLGVMMAHGRSSGSVEVMVAHGSSGGPWE